MSSGPLDGYRVVDLSTMISGPMATQVLAELGIEDVAEEAD